MNNFLNENLEKIDNDFYLDFADDLLIKLFPLNRSILNEGVLKSLEIIKEKINFDIIKIPTGYECYDWIVPDQWDIKEAYIEAKGKKIIDFKENNLHVLNYSQSVSETLTYKELEGHLHYIEDQPNAIPYKTSYYKKNWGFCLTYNQFIQLDRDINYKVVIKSDHKKGNIHIAEKLIKGEIEKEILISAYTCHPSMANDSLSGVIVWAMLLHQLQHQKPYYSYRFVLLPETIGAIAYLKLREEKIKSRVLSGFVLTTCGGPGKYGYKSSFKGNDLVDKCVDLAFKKFNIDYIKYPFDINGSDERQYSSPYFRIPCGTITKDKYYEYKEYHTSLDNLSFVKKEFLFNTFELYMNAIQNIEFGNFKYITLNPACEPFLTKRELYSVFGVTISNVVGNSKNISYSTSNENKITSDVIDSILWLMYGCDGHRSLLDIALESKKNLFELFTAANILIEYKLIKKI